MERPPSRNCRKKSVMIRRHEGGLEGRRVLLPRRAEMIMRKALMSLDGMK